MILLEDFHTPYGRIRITKSRSDGTCTYYQDGCCHSQINTEGVSTCGYVHVMYSIIRQTKAQSVLMIGCAGGSLATMLHRLGCDVTMIDVNPHAFTLAKRYFQMPEAVECKIDDGWSYLLRTKRRFDVIAVDAFNSDGTVPEQFTNEAFFMRAKEVLQSSGVITMNVMVDHDMDMRADFIAQNMEAAKMPVILFDWPGQTYRNVIIAGGTVVEQIQITSKNKPKFVEDEVGGVVRRTPKKKAARHFA